MAAMTFDDIPFEENKYSREYLEGLSEEELTTLFLQEREKNGGYGWPAWKMTHPGCWKEE